MLARDRAKGLDSELAFRTILQESFRVVGELYDYASNMLVFGITLAREFL
jgi:hypothetical protein